MRIAVSNPDNIGDFVLRQPMYAALLQAGHELLLIVRDFVAPLAAELFPQCQILECSGNPYARDFSLHDPLGEQLVRSVAAFAPELFVVAPFQRTQLEESLAASLPNVRCIGLKGPLFQARPEVTAVSTIPFAKELAVPVESSELEKNALLCGAILGTNVRLDPPSMVPPEAGIRKAEALLERVGMSGEPFWVVCAGDADGKQVKNWSIDKWVEFCRAVASEGHRLLFIGTPDEHASTTVIQTAIGVAGLGSASLTGTIIGLDALVGILHLASGYFGKDTGPMHLAAALGKPVLAVFGGGNWPRFLPSAKTGCAMTVEVPCAGCDWACTLSRSYCVKDVPVKDMVDKALAMIHGRLSRFDVHAIKPTESFKASIVRELIDSVRTEQKKVSQERSNFIQWHDDRTRDIAELRDQLATISKERDEIAYGAASRIARGLEHPPDGTIPPDDPDTLRLSDVTQKARVLEERASALEFESRLAAVNLRQMIEDRASAERREARFRERAVRKIAGIRKRIATLEEENRRLAGLEPLAASAAALKDQLEAQTVLLSSLRLQLDTAESRYEGRLADQAQRLKRTSEELASALALIPDLREELAHAQADAISQLQELHRRIKHAKFGIEQIRNLLPYRLLKILRLI